VLTRPLRFRLVGVAHATTAAVTAATPPPAAVASLLPLTPPPPLPLLVQAAARQLLAMENRRGCSWGQASSSHSRGMRTLGKSASTSQTLLRSLLQYLRVRVGAPVPGSCVGAWEMAT
jgi:hypothetical protein